MGWVPVRARQNAGRPADLRLNRANNGGAEPIVGSIPGAIRSSRLELGSAVGTEVLGVHREGSGRFRNAPPPQGPCFDQTTLFALLQSDPFERTQQSSARGSKLRRQATWTCRTFPAWPGARRHVPHPASLPQLLVCNLACGAAMGSVYSLCKGRGISARDFWQASEWIWRFDERCLTQNQRRLGLSFVGFERGDSRH